MEFDNTGICILKTITTKDECEAYKTFLMAERIRHEKEMGSVTRVANNLEGIDTEFTSAMSAFYRSAASRHQDDLCGITKTLAKIEAHKATLEVK